MNIIDYLIIAIFLAVAVLIAFVIHKHRNARRVTAILAVIGAVLAVFQYGRWEVTPTLKVLERAASSDDVVTANFSLYGGIHTESARYLGTRAGSKIFVSTRDANGEEIICLLIEPGDTASPPAAGCAGMRSGHEPIVTLSDQAGRELTLVPDQYDTNELQAIGWTKISDNLFRGRQ
ncbi:hypothetical protein Achl_3403 [Pseudarthrobacter chlorophenolicus A6]|uniref:Uncharacterized protein n=1 Tax=Pseudarthrobacter chlorophenolicus (strain ATCC 700700 / DSM 12829 / CIP 107037 / JCM 12360 / KCTC 9906 / NCIMB 13794 / A6) TaxID=452863 RepID=B8HH69_PSECP|nr:hypothetical protein [Pseudarthrobacter chlorophenolicus]ACL41360.1 hypothetical protein Achl_3403 [Pseudarthrobacter chlorophenolicus A6]SDQ65518.1 hypothetical protein SAMN04489738_2076 [Pseudarthrobacter chlorophenolicus]